MTPEDAALCERLKEAKYVREGRDDRDYLCDFDCDEEDFGARPINRNPDGPAAAAAIERLSAENEALREAAIAVRAAADHAPPMSSIRRVEWKIKQFDPAIKLVRAVLARTTLKGADQ